VCVFVWECVYQCMRMRVYCVARGRGGGEGEGELLTPQHMGCVACLRATLHPALAAMLVSHASSQP